MSNNNHEIKKAIDSFDVETARLLLREALKDANSETYYLASLVALDDEQKQYFLKKALELDPFHEKSHTLLKNSEKAKIVPNKPDSVKATSISQVSNPGELIDINQFISAVAQGDSDSVPMLIIPVKTGLVRTKLPLGSNVFLIERDERAEWFLCGYQSPIGQSVIGWIPFENLQNFMFMEKEINLLDLPITRFEPYNTRSDLQKLIQEKRKTLRSPAAAIGSMAVTIMILVFALFCILSISMGIGNDVGLWIFMLSLWGAFLIAIFAIVKQAGKIKSDREKDAHFLEELKRLEILQKTMRTEYEMLRDDQRVNMGIQAGLNTAQNLIGIAGNTVAQKILTSSNSKGKKR